MKSFFFVFSSLAFFLLSSSVVTADSVVLKDGSSFTGEILTLNQYMVAIKTKNKIIRKRRKHLESFTFDNPKCEEYFQKLSEAEPEGTEKVFLVALWCHKNHPKRYKAALIKCWEMDATFDKAGELLGYRKNSQGVWEQTKDLKIPRNPSAEDLSKFKKEIDDKGNKNTKPDKGDKGDKGGKGIDEDEERQKRLIAKKAKTAWKKISTKFKQKKYEKIKEELAQIANDYPETKEGKQARDVIDNWQRYLEDRTLDPIRRIVKVKLFEIAQVQFSGMAVPWPECRLELAVLKDLDELSIGFWAAKRKGKDYVRCRSWPKMQTFIDIDKKKGHKVIGSVYTESIPEFGNVFDVAYYEIKYKGKLLYSGHSKGSEKDGKWWLDASGNDKDNKFWLGWHKSSEANQHQHPWQTNTLWTKEECTKGKRPGWKRKKKK